MSADPATITYATRRARWARARAFACGLDRDEPGGEADPCKLEWTDVVQTSSGLDLHPAALTGQGSRLLQQHARPGAQPAVERARTVSKGVS